MLHSHRNSPRWGHDRRVDVSGSEQRDYAPGDHAGADHGSTASFGGHPGFEPRYAVPSAFRHEDVAEQRYLEQDLLHQAEADDQQYRVHGSGVEVVDLV